MNSKISRFRQALVYAAFVAFALAGTTARGQTTSEGSANGTAIATMKVDLANRSPDIRWPEGFGPSQADLFSHNEIKINASCERLESHHRSD